MSETDAGASDDTPPLNPLMYPLADLSSRRQASCNSSQALQDQTGVAATHETVHGFMLEALRAQPLQDPSWYELVPATIAEAAAGQVLDESSLAAPPVDVAEFRRAHRELIALQSGKASRYEAAIRDAAQRSTREAFDRVAADFAAAAANNPLTLAALARRGLERLAEITPAPIDERPLAGLAALCGAFDLMESRPSAVPSHKHHVLSELMLTEGHVQTRRVCVALATKQVAIAVGRRTVGLAEAMRRAERLGRQAEERLADMARQLGETTAAHRRLRAAAQSGGRVWLEGPSSECLLSEMSQQAGLSRAELVAAVVSHFLAELTDRYPTTEMNGAAAALAALPAEECLAAFYTVLEPLLKLPPFYEAVAEYGPERLADDLFLVAAPLLHLERASELLNVEITEVSTATLPASREAGEAEIAARLRAALEHRPGMKVNVAEGGDQTASVVRTLNGFSAAILADNDVLARAYVDSCSIDHHPHLFGYIADSPDGRASALVVELVHQLDQENL